MIKRKTKVKIKKQRIKKRKLKANPYVDSRLSSLLTEAFVFGNKNYFSHALLYYNTSYKCDDCEKYYDEKTYQFIDKLANH